MQLRQLCRNCALLPSFLECSGRDGTLASTLEHSDASVRKHGPETLAFFDRTVFPAGPPSFTPPRMRTIRPSSAQIHSS